MSTLRSAWRYGITFLTITLAVTLRVSLIPLIGTSTAYLTAFPAVAIIAAWLGIGPAFFASTLAVAFFEAFMLTPYDSSGVRYAFLIRGSMVFLTAAAVGHLVNRWHDASRRAETEAAAARQAAEDLRQAKLAAEQANIAKSHFLATMSHELRTPLTAVLGFSELLADDHTGAEDRANYQIRLKRNAEQLRHLIDDILDLSKIEAGKLEIDRTETDLVGLIRDC